MKRSDVEDTRPTLSGLAKMARGLGYEGNSDLESLIYFFEDNPGASEAVIEFVLDHGKDRELNDLEEEDDEEET